MLKGLDSCHRRPFLLPCIVGAMFAVCAFLSNVFMMEETHAGIIAARAASKPQAFSAVPSLSLEDSAFKLSSDFSIDRKGGLGTMHFQGLGRVWEVRGGVIG